MDIANQGLIVSSVRYLTVTGFGDRPGFAVVQASRKHYAPQADLELFSIDLP
jgi:hypothetical protein